MGDFLTELKDLAVGRETSFGVVGTISEWVAAKKADFNLAIPLEYVPAMKGRREEDMTYTKSKTLAPSLAFDVDAESGLGVIMRSFFGTSSSAAAQGTFSNKHTFTFRAAADADSMFARYTQFGTVMKNYVGLVPSKLAFDFPKDNNVTADVTFVGQDEKTGTNTAGTHGTMIPFLSTGDLAVTLDGTLSSDIADLKLSIDNGAKALFTLGTLRTCSTIKYGKVAVEGSFDIFFTDENERTKFINKTAMPLTVKCKGPVISGTNNYEFNLLMPKIEYAAFPFGDSEGIVAAGVTFKAIYGANATGTGAIIAEIINTKAAY